MKIAIAGYGVEGESNYRYWSRDARNTLTIVDESEHPKHPLPKGVSTILGEGAFQQLNDFDMVIRTAGLSPYKLKTNAKVWSATNEFFEQCPVPIIGVTGTKGKGTTATMIASILRANYQKVWLVGNIGTAALDVLNEISEGDAVVYELSSFQLWDAQRSPNVAVVLGIESEHLDVHKDMKDYVSAKQRIRTYQTAGDVCVYHPTNEYARLIALSNTAAAMQRYGIKADGGAYVHEGSFYVDEQEICSTDVVTVPGKHNIENACAAITVAKHLGISNKMISKGLSSFKALPHRLEHVATINGVDYYNDSFSSSPTATVAAITSFTQPEIVIIGGVHRGASYEQLVKTIASADNVKEVVLIGEVRHTLAEALKTATVAATITEFDGTTMSEIVDYVHTKAVSGDVVVLSPGYASFDMFTDFYDRGDQFRKEVQAL